MGHDFGSVGGLVRFPSHDRAQYNLCADDLLLSLYGEYIVCCMVNSDFGSNPGQPAAGRAKDCRRTIGLASIDIPNLRVFGNPAAGGQRLYSRSPHHGSSKGHYGSYLYPCLEEGRLIARVCD